MENYNLIEQVRFKDVDTYFKSICEIDLNNIYSILKYSMINERKISLRFIEWFILYYCKKNNIFINMKNGQRYFYDEFNDDLLNTNVYINIYNDYKLQLKYHTKKYFDPFKRQTVFNYSLLDSDNTIETTISQLNFFKWLHQNNILTFIIENLHFLKKEMVYFNKEIKNNKLSEQVKKSRISSISSSATKDDITLDFDSYDVSV